MSPLPRRPGRDPRIPLTYKPFHVLSFDPGGTTGWASSEWLPPSQRSYPDLRDYKQISFNSGQIGAGKPHHLELWSFLLGKVTPGFTEVVCESFEFRQHLDPNKAKHKVELISRDYIGIIILFCEMHNVKLTMNTASTGKVFVTDEKLKQLDLWTPGTPHGNDAMRHNIRYLTINKRMNFIMQEWL